MYLLVEPQNEGVVQGIKERVGQLGYLALTRQEFMSRIQSFYVYQTGMGTNLLIMTMISFIVGLSISGQTFYTFILENLERFGALKAIGARNRELIGVVLFQATVTALLGYGLGIGICASLINLARLRLPDYFAMMTFTNLGLSLVMVLVIAAVSSYFGTRRVLRIEPFDVFRG
jgi:putative ABC transport system permease protein